MGFVSLIIAGSGVEINSLISSTDSSANETLNAIIGVDPARQIDHVGHFDRGQVTQLYFLPFILLPAVSATYVY